MKSFFFSAVALTFLSLFAADADLSLAPRKALPAEIANAEKAGIQIVRGKMLSGWNMRIHGPREETAGRLTVNSDSVELSFPDNTSGGVQFISRGHFTAPGRHMSIRAKGNGTLHFYFQPDSEAKLHSIGSYLVNTDQWHTFRSDAVKSPKSSYRLICSVYGKVELADAGLAEIPAVDPAAELVFYAPFEAGSANAVVSAGNTAPFGAVDFEAVPGICGQAIRISRNRRLQKNGLLRYPIGFGYEFMKNIISPDSGTIEFFFRPLPEMLQKQQWDGFPLFYLGDTSWQWLNSHDFDLTLKYRSGKLILTLNEHARNLLFPTDAPQNPPTRSGSCMIGDPEKFISNWHHLAFCYDEKERKVFLDGKPVISCKALKKPAVSSRIPQLLFANGHIANPAVMSSDLDELKIYRQVKYHCAFKPSHLPERFAPVPSEKNQPPRCLLKPGKPAMRNAGTEVVVPLKYGNNNYELLISFANGYPLVLHPKRNLTSVRVNNIPSLPRMVMEDLKLTDTGITGRFAKYGTSFAWNFREENGVVTAVLELNRTGGFWHAYLEPRIAVRRLAGPFSSAYDGWMTRQIRTPFLPFSFDDVMMALPLCAAWNGREGISIALTPDTLCGDLRRGMDDPETIFLKLRTAMKDVGKGKFTFEIAPFDSCYEEAEAIDAWHGRHRDYFGYNAAFDERCYGNITETLPWNTEAFRKRNSSFSYAEIARRSRAGWVWFYESGPSVGNWSADRELLDELPPINIPYGGDARQNLKWNKLRQQKIDAFEDAGVAAAPYISSWSERRTAGFFTDSVIDADESYNGIVFWPNYWKRGVVDQIMMPKFTSYGTFLRRQIDSLLKQHAEVNFFSYDLCGYDYRFRKSNSAGWLNAFDEGGAYLPHVTALGALLEELRHIKTADGHRITVTGNVDAARASFNTSSRIANTVHEQNYTETTQNWGKLRQQTRLHGERPTVFLPMPPVDGNFFGAEDPRLLRYSAIWLHHSHILLGALFNIRQNSEIFGVKESVDALDPLLRLQSLGYRQSPRAQITADLLIARYGELEQGAWAVVNFHPAAKLGVLTMDSKMFGRTPIPAIDGRSIEIGPENHVRCDLQPLSFFSVETLGSAPAGQQIHCTSTLKRDPDKVTWKLTFKQDTDLSGWRICKAFGSLPKRAAKGQTLILVSADRRWSCTPDELQKTVNGFSGNVIITVPSSKEGARAGRRIAEFFRFGSKINGKKCKVAFADSGNILLKTGEKESLALQNGKVVITARPKEFRRMTDLLLANLEKMYPYYSVFGKQQPVKPLDWTQTGLQKKFYERSKVIGRLRSTSEAAAEFRQYLQEKNENPYQKF